MQPKQIDAARDPEAVLLARVYALILAWDTPEPARADAADTPTPRKAQTKKREGGKSNE